MIGWLVVWLADSDAADVHIYGLFGRLRRLGSKRPTVPSCGVACTRRHHGWPNLKGGVHLPSRLVWHCDSVPDDLCPVCNGMENEAKPSALRWSIDLQQYHAHDFGPAAPQSRSRVAKPDHL